MKTSAKTQDYWIDILLGWAEDRLSPPQFDECRQVMRDAQRSLQQQRGDDNRSREKTWPYWKNLTEDNLRGVLLRLAR